MKMNDDGRFFETHDGVTVAPSDENPPIIIREVGDFEVRLYFNPSRFDYRQININLPLGRLSLRTGFSGVELDRIKFGEIDIRLNPMISDKEDIIFIKKVFLEYFKNLKPVTL